MSKSLIKLIDASLLPASLLVVTKLFSVFFAINILNVEWSLNEYSNTFFSVRPAISAFNIESVSTLSDLIVFIVIAIGFGVQLFYAIYLHDTHIPPKLLSKLAEKNLLSLVKGSFEVFHNAAIWLIFLWVTEFTIWVNVLLQKTTGSLGAITLLTTVALTVILLRDVYQEIELEKKNFGTKHAFT